MAICLNTSSVGQLPETISVPHYDRDAVSAGILHFGVGNFHRAHQAVYLDRLLDLGEDAQWGIAGAGLLPSDKARMEELRAQDWLYSVVELASDGPKARVVGAMVDYCVCDPQALIERIASPATRIVSLTITEGGYYIDPGHGGFNAYHPDMVHDAAHPDAPRSVFGTIIAGLRARRAAGHAAPTIMSCDNLPENGKITRQTLIGLARLSSDAFGDWVEKEVSCPNSMVDRITPATSPDHRAEIEREFQMIDAAPVVCETFSQWVLEDDFPLGRPMLEKVGVQFVEDVAPYELMKLRLLNAGHAAMSYPSALLGYAHVHDAMADPDLVNWLTRLMTQEVIPILPPVDGIDYRSYFETCLHRFANPAIKDSIHRLCIDGSNRQPKFIFPTIEDRLRQGKRPGLLALELAFWCSHVQSCARTGRLDDLGDPLALDLAQAAERARETPAAFLSVREVFGPLGTAPELVEDFTGWMDAIAAHGVRSVLRQLSRGVAHP